MIRASEIADRVSHEVVINGLRVVCLRYQDAASDNLIAFDQQGNEIWRVDARPDGIGNDVWVSAQIRNGTLEGTTWNGFCIELEPATGKKIKSTFVK